MLKPEDRSLFAALLAVAFAFVLCWVVPSPYGEPNQNAGKCTTHECREDAATEALAKYTEWLVYATTALAFFSILQGIFLYRADKTARISADAAKQSADAAALNAGIIPKMERAFVFFDSAESNDLGSALISNMLSAIPTPQQSIIKITYGFKNHGRTPAIVTTVNVEARYFETGSPERLERDPLPMPLIVSGEDGPPDGEYGCAITGGEFRKAKAGEGRIFFWARLVYRDVFDTPHETGICAHWDFRESRFVVSKSNELNYYT